ncbi:MAG: type III toxin-antitoxin system ToxN/AbiQ family toxin, partial [Eubacterium sp.]
LHQSLSFNKQQRTNILIKNRSGKTLSSIRLSFMFPVPDHLVTVKNFSLEDPYYKRLLLEELNFCNKNADKIISKAKYIYDSVTSGNNLMIAKNCCDTTANKTTLQVVYEPGRSANNKS